MFVAFEWLCHYFEVLVSYVAFHVGCPARLVSANWCTVYAAVGLSADGRVALRDGTIALLMLAMSAVTTVLIVLHPEELPRRKRRAVRIATELRMLPRVPGSEGCASRLRRPPIK